MHAIFYDAFYRKHMNHFLCFQSRHNTILALLRNIPLGSWIMVYETFPHSLILVKLVPNLLKKLVYIIVMRIFGQLGFYPIDLFSGENTIESDHHVIHRMTQAFCRKSSAIPNVDCKAFPRLASALPPFSSALILLMLTTLLPYSSVYIFLQCLLCLGLCSGCKGYRRKQNSQNPSLHMACNLPVLFLFNHTALFYCLHVLPTFWDDFAYFIACLLS